MGSRETFRDISRSLGIAESVRYIGRLAAAGAVAGIASMPFTAVGARVEHPIGPLDTRTQVVADGSATLDFGAIGEVSAPVALPRGLGLRVEVDTVRGARVLPELQEIAIAAASGTLTQDAAFGILGDPLADVSEIKDQLLSEVFGSGVRVAAGTAIVLMALGMVRRRLGADDYSAHRGESHADGSKNGRSLMMYTSLGALAALSLTTGFAYSSDAARDFAQSIDPDMLAETIQIEPDSPLQMTADGIARAVEILGKYFEETDSYYTDLTTRVEAGLEASGYVYDPDNRVLVVYTDIHGNYNMNSIICLITEYYHADAILSLGDEVGSGLPQEYDLMFRRWEGADIPFAIVPGNHDLGVEDLRAVAGEDVVVLDGLTVPVGPFRVIGDSDPRQSTLFESGMLPRRPESPLDTANRVIEEGCETGAEIVALHDFSDYLQTSIDPAECGILIQLGGHMHPQETAVPTYVMNEDGSVASVGLPIIESATGATNPPYFGPLQASAGIKIVTVSPGNQRVSVYTVTMNPDKTVVIRQDASDGVDISDSVPGPTDGSTMPNPVGSGSASSIVETRPRSRSPRPLPGAVGMHGGRRPPHHLHRLRHPKMPILQPYSKTKTGKN